MVVATGLVPQAWAGRWGWGLPGPGIEPMSPALAGGFSTTGPPGKPPHPHPGVLKDTLSCLCSASELFLLPLIFPDESTPIQVSSHHWPQLVKLPSTASVPSRSWYILRVSRSSCIMFESSWCSQNQLWEMPSWSGQWVHFLYSWCCFKLRKEWFLLQKLLLVQETRGTLLFTVLKLWNHQ